MLFKEENNYLNIANKIMDEGYEDSSRTGISIKKIHAAHLEFSLLDGRVPILSTRKIPFKSAIVELLWFISGSTDVWFLKRNKVSIWDSWVKPETAVYNTSMDAGLRSLEKLGLIKPKENINDNFFLKYGPGVVNSLLGELTGVKVEDRTLISGSIGDGAYGAQWRKWDDIRVVGFDDLFALEELRKLGYTNIDNEINPDEVIQDNKPKYSVLRKKHDQLQEAIDLINNNPNSRRIIVSAWNPGKLDQAVLPPCHSFFQFLPFEKDGIKYLDLSLTCRSQDFLVGTVFNVLQYSVLCHIVAKLTGRVANKLYWSGNNTHIYNNQFELFEQEHRERMPLQNKDICLVINDKKEFKSIDDFTVNDISITGYDSFHEKINYPVAV